MKTIFDEFMELNGYDAEKYLNDEVYASLIDYEIERALNPDSEERD